MAEDGKYAPPEIVQEALRKYDEAKIHHDVFVRAYERRERAYRGVLRAQSNAAKWRHKEHTPHIFDLVETIVANTMEEGLAFTARPAPRVDLSLEEAERLLEQSESVENLLRHEHRVDEMDAKQRPLFLTMAIGGRGVGKTSWNYSTGRVRRQGVKEREIYGPEGQVLGTVPMVTEVEEDNVLRDNSTFEVVDPRDFIVHESARALQPWEHGGAQHLFHRCWYSFEQLKLLEAGGYFKNVDKLNESLDFTEEYNDREQEVWERNKTKDLIEVLEYWCFKKGEVYRTFIGNRVILLRDEEASPFWHGGYPFVVAASMPQPFSLIGMSEVELVESLQEIIWELTNQRLDNIELINNAIMLIRSDIDDTEAFEWYPGAMWPVEGDPEKSIAPLRPPYQLANLTLEAEAQLMGQLQNVSGGGLLASGAQQAVVDQKTATGASLVMSAAQRRLSAKKYQSHFALKQEAQMRLKNVQQFADGNRLVHVIGPTGAMSFQNIPIIDIQGDYMFELEPMAESVNREQKKAEALQFGQIMGQMAPLAAASGDPVLIKEIIIWMAKQWGIVDAERFFAQQQQPQVAAALSGGGGGAGAPPGAGGPGQPEGPNMGITSDTAVDAGQPSATGGLSGSPEAAMARALSMNGGMNV